MFCTSSCSLSDSSQTPTWQGRYCCWRREGSQWWSNLPKVIDHKTTCQAAKEGVSAEELKWAEKLMLDLKVSDEASPSNLTDFNPQPQFPPMGLNFPVPRPHSPSKPIPHHRYLSPLSPPDHSPTASWPWVILIKVQTMWWAMAAACNPKPPPVFFSNKATGGSRVSRARRWWQGQKRGGRQPVEWARV